jgi:hypothetical protein
VQGLITKNQLETIKEELVPPIFPEEITAPPVKDPSLIEALKRNAAIDPSNKPCAHPIAI